VLIVMIIPCLVRLASGKAGRIRTVDIALLLFSFWAALSFTVVDSLQVGLESGGVLFLETMGAYLIARCYIRDAQDFYNAVKVLVAAVIFLLPFAVLEVVTGRDIILELFSKILPSHPIMDKDPRWGLRRVQAIFEHPILMGVSCGSVLVLAHYVLGYGETPIRRWRTSLSVALAAGLSLSSGPLAALAVETLLMLWNWGLGRVKFRWKLLIALMAVAVVMIELFAKRPLPNILFSAFAFEANSAFFRILIWDFGTLSALNHPWFGVGHGEWDRPAWMASSIDMFWLYNAVVYGIPAAVLMLLAFFAVFIPVGLLKNLDDRLYQYRAAFLISLTSLFLMGWMVHFWNATFVLFVFLLGSGVWFLDIGKTPNTDGAAASARLRRKQAAPAPRDSRPGRRASADRTLAQVKTDQ
jgi:hypothetical protein